MTQQERIKKAAFDYINSDAVSPENMQQAFGDFINGAKYALQNQWISVDEELPKDEKYVFVKLSCSRLPWTAMFDYNIKSWVDINHVAIHGVTHWMTIPEIGGEA